VVFVTAYDEYAIAAFDQGAIDYLLKPVEEDRLARTVQRLKARQADSGTNDEQSLTQRLARIERALDHSVGRSRLKWLQASQGNQLRLIDVDEVLYFQSDEKYTRLRTVEAEFLIRLSLRDLLDQLDPDRFWQVHRGTVVRVSAIDRVLRDDTGRLRICLRGNDDTLEVSRSYHPLFRQM
jgi:DNA-binding LytR/AlgR family response regulator